MEKNVTVQNAWWKLESMNLWKIFLSFVLLLILIILLCSSFYTIKSTERWILSTFGKMKESSIEPGLHFKLPIIQSIQKINVQQKKFDWSEKSYTKDLQTADVSYTINYDIIKWNVSSLIKNVWTDYHDKIIVPFIRSTMKESFWNFAATEIVANRDEVRAEIEKMLIEVIDDTYFSNIQFQLTNIDFDDDFENAIKEKQVAEQQALKAKNVTIQVEEQAKQTKIKAEAEAESIKIRAKSLESNPKLVEYEAVQKRDGKLPTYMLWDSVPFIDIN